MSIPLSHTHTRSFTHAHSHMLIHTRINIYSCMRVHTCMHTGGGNEWGRMSIPLCTWLSTQDCLTFLLLVSNMQQVNIPAFQGTRSSHMNFLSPVPSNVCLPYSLSQATKAYLDSRLWYMQRCGASPNRPVYHSIPTPKAKGSWGRGDRKTVRARGSGGLL